MIFYFLMVSFSTVTLVQFLNMSNCCKKMAESGNEMRLEVEREMFEFLVGRGLWGKSEDLASVWLCYRYGTCFRRIFEIGHFDPSALNEDEYKVMRDSYNLLCDEMKEKYNKCLEDLKKYLVDAEFVRNEDEFNEKKFGLSCLVFLMGSIEQAEKFCDVVLEGTDLGERVRALREEVERKLKESTSDES